MFFLKICWQGLYGRMMTDMHLKNFSLLTTEENNIILSPAYDLVCTKIAMPDDKDEMALTINGRRSRLHKSDFDSLAKNLRIPGKAMENSYGKFVEKMDEASQWIDISFLPEKMKSEYKKVIAENVKKII